MSKLSCYVGKFGKESIDSIDKHCLGVDYTDGSGALAIGLLPHRGELRSIVFSRITQRSNPGRTVRKDSVVLCEVKVTISDLFLKSLTERECLRFFEETVTYLQGEYNEENRMYAVVHRDGDASHLHYGFVPMTEDGHLSAKRIVGREGLRRLHEGLPQRLRACGFSIENEDKIQSFHPPAEERAAELTRRKTDNISSYREPPRFEQAPETGEPSLNRENQCLKLEILLLERQLKGVIDVIKSDHRLELLYLSQMEKISSQKHERLEYISSSTAKSSFSGS